jgi:hypothetical protein
MTLPPDLACCSGWGDGPEDWLEECQDCMRRTAPASEAITPVAGFALRQRDGGLPPNIVTLWCESYIPPDRPEDQRLRELARRQGLVG